MRLPFLLAAMLATALPVEAASPASCSAIDDDAARLRCYDEAAGRKPATKPPAPAATTAPATSTSPLIAHAMPSASDLGSRWELDAGTKAPVFTFRPHKQNYLLPFTHTDSVNKAPYQATLDALASAGLVPPGSAPIDADEAAFQISFKTKLWEGLVSDRADLWAGYTQRSFWQVYNGDVSAPFRDTNYEPEAIVSVRTDVDVLGLKWRLLNLGLVHQSNGRSEPLSRSWNRAYAEFAFERGPFTLSVRPWYRFKEDAKDDDNPDITKYLGHGDLTATYKAGRHQFGLLARQNFSSGYGAAQLDWSFPLWGYLRGYAQVFTGYGYNLLDYNHRQTVGGIGFLLTDRY
jgi:phospholipase A1